MSALPAWGWRSAVPRLADLLQRFFFNAPAFSDRFLQLPHRHASTARPAMILQLANLAVGPGRNLRDHGPCRRPGGGLCRRTAGFSRPISSTTPKTSSVLAFISHDARPLRLLADDLNFMRVRKAMAAVVDNEKGTGRRLRGAVAPPGHQDRYRRGRSGRARCDRHRFPAL